MARSVDMVALSIVIAVVAFIVLQFQCSKISQNSVLIQQWELDPVFLRSLLRDSKPTVLTTSPDINWTAMKLWTPTYISDAVPELEHIYRSNVSTFCYFDVHRTDSSLHITPIEVCVSFPYYNNFT
jgi:hypothetical protein